ncbi:MAG: DUF2125 domain-containing protein [Roseovarius sp.]
MRGLLGVIVIAIAGWSGFWYVGQIGVSREFARWFEARRAAGWVAEVADLHTRGYPLRFDTVLGDLALADPATGLAWEAPRLRIVALSYRPNHVIVQWPSRQLLATPLDKYVLESREMQASLITGADIRLPLERMTLTAAELAVTPQSGDQPLRADALRLAAARQPAAPATYRLGLAADGLSPALDWRVRLDPGGRLPERFDAFRADLTVRFDKPWDRSAIERARPQPRHIDIRLAEARWGRLELQAAGTLDVDDAGLPEGEIALKARNWREIVRMAQASGALGETSAAALEDALSLVAQMAGNPRTLDVTLNFRNGRVRLGPVPLGAAPVLRIR